MKSIRKMSLLLLIMAFILAACGDSGNKKAEAVTKKGEKVKLTIWHNFAGDDLRAKTVRGLIDKFIKDNPQVELDAQAILPDGYR